MSKKYKRLSLIGSGSYGQAWLVAEHGTGKKYVSKVIKVSRLTDKEMDQSITEVMVLARCNHGNIIRYVEAFVGDGALHIVMEYANGGDLHRRIQKQNGIYFTPETILGWFVQLVAALEYIHGRNILHRDLKSQNVFLTSTDQVKLGDFGIARVLQKHEDHALTTIGTPFYISPEICQKKPYNAKTDMWAAGCLLYEMCLLHVPFTAADFSGLVVRILECQYDPLQSYFGPTIQYLVGKLLIVQPDQRLSAKDLLNSPHIRPFVETHVRGPAQQRKGHRSRSLVAVCDVNNQMNESHNADGRSEQSHRTRSLVRNTNKKDNGKTLLHHNIQRSYSQNNIPQRCNEEFVRDKSLDGRNKRDYKKCEPTTDCKDNCEKSRFCDDQDNVTATAVCNVQHEGVQRNSQQANEAESPEMTPEVHVKRTYTVSNPVFRRLSQASPFLSETIRRQRESLTVDDREVANPQQKNHLQIIQRNVDQNGKDNGDEDDVFDSPCASRANLKAKSRNTDSQPSRKNVACDINTCMNELDEIKHTVEQPRRKSRVDSRTYVISNAFANNNNNNINPSATVDVIETQYLAASVVKNDSTQACQILLDTVAMEIGNEKAKKMVSMVTTALDSGQSYQEICDTLGTSLQNIQAAAGEDVAPEPSLFRHHFTFEAAPDGAELPLSANATVHISNIDVAEGREDSRPSAVNQEPEPEAVQDTVKKESKGRKRTLKDLQMEFYENEIMLQGEKRGLINKQAETLGKLDRVLDMVLEKWT